LGAIKRGFSNAQALYPSVQQKKDYDEDKEEVTEVKPAEVVVANTSSTEVSKAKTGCITGDCKFGYGVAVNRYTMEKYAGGWNDGRREGVGIEFYNGGDKKFEGEFTNSQYNGKGRYYFKNGDIFEGTFTEGEMNGEVNVYYYRNGDRLFVRYVEGKKQGKAKIVFSDGTISHVYFRDDKIVKR
jgi:hypothetical protein